MKLYIYKEAKTRIPAKAIHALFALIIESETKPDWKADINLVFTHDRRLRKLNAKYRSKDKATDVLSFNVDAPSLAGGVFGEVYISCETAKRQAEEYGLSLVQEYLRLTCHGLLHLFGYDHIRSSDKRTMTSREQMYLSQIDGGVR